MAMKILLIGDYPPPQGGLAVHMQQLHAYLLSRGAQVRVLDIGKGEGSHPDVVRVRGPAALGAELARALTQGFLVHLHTSGNNPKAWLVAAAAAAVRWPGAVRVITLHSGLLPDYLAASRARRLLARAVLAGYSRVVAVSEPIRAALVRCGVPAAKIDVAPAFLAHGVRPGAVPAGFEEVRARHPVLLAMAHHPSPVYGRDLMFAALRKLSESTPGVGLATYGPGSHSGAFADAARAAGVEDRVHAFGELPQAAAQALVSRADVFVRPTTHDGDAISVREALMLRVRCVASAVCARPSGTWCFAPGDADDLARQIQRALQAQPLAHVAADAGPFLHELYQRLGSGRGASGAPFAP